MNRINHFFTSIGSKVSSARLTTPAAIIIGAIIIGLSIIAYGFIVGPKSAPGTIDNPLPKILKSIGVNKKDFAKCVDNGEKAQAVANSLAEGGQAGVNGTPATFILREEGGVFYEVANVSGAREESFFTAAINQALSLTSVAKLPKFKGRAIDQTDFVEATNPTKIYVVEYSDAECPFCTRLHPTMAKIRTDYKGRIAFVYRHFPLVSIHPHAQKEAEMMECVGSLGGTKAYYSFIDAIFDFKIKNNIGYIPVEQQ